MPTRKRLSLSATKKTTKRKKAAAEPLTEVPVQSQEPLGDAVRVRFLQRRSFGRVRDRPLHGVLRHVYKDPRRADRRGPHRPGRRLDEADCAKSARPGGRM
jgi:hypothetical protein